MVEGQMQVELPKDLPSVDYEGYIYHCIVEIGTGGQTDGVYLGQMLNPSDPEDEMRLVTLKFISAEYLGHDEKGPRRQESLEREAEHL